MNFSIYGLVLAAVVVFTNACGGGDDDDNAPGAAAGSGNQPGAGGSAGSPGPALNCSTRCTTKFTTCMFPADQVGLICQMLVCGQSPTEAQLACVEATSCDELLNSADPPLALCPGDQGGGGSGQGGSGQGGSPNTGDKIELGGTCDCGGASTCADTTFGPCKAGLTCVDLFTTSTAVKDLGFCSQKCTALDSQGNSDCPSGYDCTSLGVDGASFGLWCTKK